MRWCSSTKYISLSIVGWILLLFFQHGASFIIRPFHIATSTSSSAVLLYMSSRAKPPKRGKGRTKEEIKGTKSVEEDLDALERAVDFKFFGRGGKVEVVDEEDDYESTKPQPKTRGPNVSKARFTGFEPQKTMKIANEDEDTIDAIQSKPEISFTDRLSDKSERKSILLGRLLRGGKRRTIEDTPDERVNGEEPQKLYDSVLSHEVVDIDDIFDDEGLATKRNVHTEESSYRLRPPPKVSPEEELAITKAQDDKAAALLAREQAQKEKRKMKRSLENNRYLKFDFESSEFNSPDGRNELFTTSNFADIGVKDEVILDNLEKMNIMNPTKIQELTIPSLRVGRDILMQAQTGSGKTLSFLLPLVEILDRDSKKVQAIVLAPSRELVTQIASVGDKLFQNTNIRVMPIIGGANVRGQIQRMRDHRPQIIVATPGRLAEIVFGLEKLKLGMIKAVIIDEVDNMLREPYTGEIKTILEATPIFKRRADNSVTENIHVNTSLDVELTTNYDKLAADQTDADTQKFSKIATKKRMVCFASATGSSPLVTEFINDLYGAHHSVSSPWEKISLDGSTSLPTTINHGLISCPRIKALEMLKKTIKSKPDVRSALIFVNDPYRVEIVCEKLLEMGIIAAPLHGDTNKDDRKDILARLRDGRLPLVVTTELAARGIDIPDLTHVINFELPTDAQHYVHRAGRCGRAGKSGLVINFATPDTKFVIRRFGKQLGIKVRDCDLREGYVHLKI